jgi:hypothetical protein
MQRVSEVSQVSQAKIALFGGNHHLAGYHHPREEDAQHE